LCIHITGFAATFDLEIAKWWRASACSAID